MKKKVKKDVKKEKKHFAIFTCGVEDITFRIFGSKKVARKALNKRIKSMKIKEVKK